MKKSLIILLVSIHLAGNTEMGQFLRLPELVTHYFQHHRQNPDLSFWNFIAMHYGGSDGTSADDDYDSQLPCHNINHSTLSLVFSPLLPEQPAAQKAADPMTAYCDCLPERITPKHTLTLLQPPRA